MDLIITLIGDQKHDFFFLGFFLSIILNDAIFDTLDQNICQEPRQQFLREKADMLFILIVSLHTFG